MLDVVALGELLIDFTCLSVDEAGYPTLAAHPGGAPANFLAALAKFGAQTAMIGKVGQDACGQMLTRTLREAGIETSGLAAAEGGGLFAAKSLFERVLTKIFSDVTMAAAGAKAPQNERTPVCGDVSQPGPAGAGTRGLSCKAFFLCPEKCACLPAAANGASRALCAVGASEALPAPCRKRACALRRERVF